MGDQAAVARLEPVVRIARRMHVAHRAGDLAGRDLQDLHVQRGVEVAGGAELNLRIAALRDERRQPADLEFPPDHDQQVGVRLSFEDEAGLGLDEVRILVALAKRVDRDLVAADFARDRGEILGGRTTLRTPADLAAPDEAARPTPTMTSEATIEALFA